MSDENNKKTESETESSEKDKMKVSFQDDKKSHENAEPMDHEDVIFYFFYGLVEKMILKRTDVGGKYQSYNIVSTLDTIRYRVLD